jgi:hypothetical protein
MNNTSSWTPTQEHILTTALAAGIVIILMSAYLICSWYVLRGRSCKKLLGKILSRIRRARGYSRVQQVEDVDLLEEPRGNLLILTREDGSQELVNRDEVLDVDTTVYDELVVD